MSKPIEKITLILSEAGPNTAFENARLDRLLSGERDAERGVLSVACLCTTSELAKLGCCCGAMVAAEKTES